MDKASVLAAFTAATKEVIVAARDLQEAVDTKFESPEGLIIALVDRILQAEAIERSERRVTPVVGGGASALRSVN